jgi:hypothetical protein
VLHRTASTNHLPLNHPSRLVACSSLALSSQASFQRDFAQTNILDRGPDNREATGLGGEDINLIGALAHIAEETLDGIGRLNVSVHGGREFVKRQEVLFILR